MLLWNFVVAARQREKWATAWLETGLRNVGQWPRNLSCSVQPTEWGWGRCVCVYVPGPAPLPQGKPTCPTAPGSRPGQPPARLRMVLSDEVSVPQPPGSQGAPTPLRNAGRAFPAAPAPMLATILGFPEATTGHPGWKDMGTHTQAGPTASIRWSGERAPQGLPRGPCTHRHEDAGKERRDGDTAWLFSAGRQRSGLQGVDRAVQRPHTTVSVTPSTRERGTSAQRAPTVCTDSPV